MTSKIHLSFTIGPVQSFVGQARRTRDLWAGSWLLSFLAENALAAAEEVGGIAIIPHRGGDKGKILSPSKSIGGIPNRFKITFDDKEEGKLAAENATSAFEEAWLNIANVVYKKFVRPVEKKGNRTAEIWKRQVECFWETSWVLGTPQGDTKTLGALSTSRKNIRNSNAQSEGGTKCSLMGNLQEISGHHGQDQKDFWKNLISHVEKQTGTDLDFKEEKGEKLCAIALIKRLFPHCIDEIFPNQNTETLQGEVSWPATQDLCVNHNSEKRGESSYALLLMDGDSMGKLVANLGEPAKVSKGLNLFASKVDGIVSRHSGRTVYAGGDDVLALLPTKDALAAADALAREYTKSFDGIEEATLSGALVFAHYKYPLRQVLKIAHHLLDDIAKEKTGRDALAIGIVQGGGLQAQWSVPWKVLRGEHKEKGFGALDEFYKKFGEEKDNDSNFDSNFNASYLYTLRHQFSKLFSEPFERPGEFGELFFEEGILDSGDDMLIDIAHGEFRRRMKKEERKSRPPEETKKEIEALLAITRQWTRDENQKISVDDNSFGFDGWRIARFLKNINSVSKNDTGETNE